MACRELEFHSRVQKPARGQKPRREKNKRVKKARISPCLTAQAGEGSGSRPLPRGDSEAALELSAPPTHYISQQCLRPRGSVRNTTPERARAARATRECVCYRGSRRPPAPKGPWASEALIRAGLQDVSSPCSVEGRKPKTRVGDEQTYLLSRKRSTRSSSPKPETANGSQSRSLLSDLAFRKILALAGPRGLRPAGLRGGGGVAPRTALWAQLGCLPPSQTMSTYYVQRQQDSLSSLGKRPEEPFGQGLQFRLSTLSLSKVIHYVGSTG
ncbi:uncharacterized protein LOC104656134 [Rhinopithecus roxellana]|uniref:uncharacterized protein LOC104656134 n=1 Tax=Rhinopithecus roxellana TaxID=61622 RepID=UPI0012375423|nr:uncharacterized protein LOC104656134 [Rhinopithecus roxellana]